MAPIVKTSAVNRSGSITAGGTAQDVYSLAQAPRYGLEFYNRSSSVMYLDWDTPATAANGIPVEPGQGWVPPEGIVPTGKMSVLCAATGAAFVCKTF